MFNFLRLPPDQLIIDNGNVFCPSRHRDTDIDNCGACPRVVEFNPGASPPYVRCRVEPKPILPGAFYI